MKSNEWVALSQRLYGWLLQLYPRAYRTAYELEMSHLFSDQCRDAYKAQGQWGILSLWLRTLVDVGVTVVREHLSDPNARVGLLEAAPNAPLPWKGVLLVLIPGLIFFISQIEQVTSSNDWFFIAFYRAGYFLIVPVLLVWVWTRRFPVWGLIPLGLLYKTLWGYGQRFQFSSLPFIGHWFFGETVVLFDTRINIYTVKYLLATLVCMILLGILIRRNVHRGRMPRNAWKWLGLYGSLIVLQITGEVYHFAAWTSRYWPFPDMTEYIQIPLWDLYQSLPFLLLVFIGMFFARRYGGFSFLLLLGYLLPTILFGRYGNEVIPFYVVSLTVLMYRFVVGLIAPVWLVRAVSISGRQRAAAIPIAIAIACHIILNLIVSVVSVGQFVYQEDMLIPVLNIWEQLIVAAGLGLAVVLYLPREQDRAVLSPPTLAGVIE